MNSPINRKKSAFTLLEVLLAMAISMMVIAGVGWLYVTIIGTWMGHKSGDLQMQHRQSILAYLQNELSFEPSRPDRDINAVDRTLKWEKIPGEQLYNAVDYLSWGAAQLPVFLKSGDWMDEVGVRFYLKFDRRQGLSLVWHPEDERIERFDIRNYDVENFIFQFPLMPEATKMELGYYDPQKDEWEFKEPAANPTSDKTQEIPDVVAFSMGEDFEDPVFIYLAKNKDSTASAAQKDSPENPAKTGGDQ